MTLPNFIIVGTFKGATTGLAARLSEHPDIFMSPVKETHFFSDDALYSQGLERYRKFFDGHANESAIGEADPSYARSRRYPDAVSRMYQAVPDARLIYIVRDPIARIESHWIEAKRGGFPMPSFDESVLSQDLDLISTSCYWQELEKLSEFYPRERIYVLFTDDFKRQPLVELERCYRFLCVASDFVNDKAGEVVRPSGGVYVDRQWVSRFVRGGPLNKVLSRAPRGLVDKLRPLVRQRVTARPEWNPDTLEKVQAIIQPDARRFLEFADKPVDFWPSVGIEAG